MKLCSLSLPILPLALSACQNADAPSGQEFDRLEAKMAKLEQSVDELQARATSQTATESEPVERLQKPAPSPDRFRLINTAFQNEPDLRYQTREECEAAKATLLEDWRLADERSRAVFTSRPTPSCLPI
jgi:outer membrane lipoprotein-sorting protein